MFSTSMGSRRRSAPEPLLRLYEEEPRLGHSLLDLDARLTRAARVVLAGVVALA